MTIMTVDDVIRYAVSFVHVVVHGYFLCLSPFSIFVSRHVRDLNQVTGVFNPSTFINLTFIGTVKRLHNTQVEPLLLLIM
jgi:hypothetical protein